MRSLLTEMLLVPVDSLVEHPENARKGSVEDIVESLDENGEFAPLVVQKSTRYVLAGNHTLRAHRRTGATHVHIVEVDVDDERARNILAAANRIADKGTYDLDRLSALLSKIDDTTGLAGTGYSADDLATLLSPPEPEPQARPERSEPPQTYGVVVLCASEEEQIGVLTDLLEQGLRARAL